MLQYLITLRSMTEKAHADVNQKIFQHLFHLNQILGAVGAGTGPDDHIRSPFQLQ